MMIFLIATDLFVTVGSPWTWLLAVALLSGVSFAIWAFFYIHLPAIEMKRTSPPDPPELVGAF